MTDSTPRTDTGKWLLDHQGLVNIGKIDVTMRGDEIDLRAAIVTIEAEAAILATQPEPLDVERLARAITVIRNDSEAYPGGLTDLSGDSTAAYIAAEYARLKP